MDSMSAGSDTPDATAEAAPAIYYDGHSNRKRMVTLRLGETLEIVEAGETDRALALRRYSPHRQRRQPSALAA